MRMNEIGGRGTTGKVLDPRGVAHPKHYNMHPSKVEAIEVCRYMNFNVGNAFKYLMRHGHKGSSQLDIEKALWYVCDEIRDGEPLPRRFSNDTWSKWCRILAHEPNFDIKFILNCLYEYQTTGSIEGLKRAESLLRGLVGQPAWQTPAAPTLEM